MLKYKIPQIVTLIPNSSFQIKGILLDSLTKEGEPYATIKIVKKEAPEHALKMLVTDMKGHFQEKENTERKKQAMSPKRSPKQCLFFS